MQNFDINIQDSVFKIQDSFVMLKKIILINPRGFCAGVRRAIKTVEKALEKYGAPVYLNHPIVHNDYVVSELEKKGAKFVKSINDIPENSVIIFSAHGVSPKIREQAVGRNLKIIDATCPLVTKIHIEAIKFFEQGYTVLLIGHSGHPEVVGIMGEAPILLIESVNDVEKLDIKNNKIACLTQTTLSVDDTEKIINKLKTKYPNLTIPGSSDICYSTQNRQNAVKKVGKIDLVLVVGSEQSSNSKRLVGAAKQIGAKSYLISSLENFKNQNILNQSSTLAITAGASTPEILVQEILNYLKQLFPNVKLEEKDYIKESIIFPLPF